MAICTSGPFGEGGVGVQTEPARGRDLRGRPDRAEVIAPPSEEQVGGVEHLERTGEVDRVDAVVDDDRHVVRRARWAGHPVIVRLRASGSNDEILMISASGRDGWNGQDRRPDGAFAPRRPTRLWCPRPWRCALMPAVFVHGVPETPAVWHRVVRSLHRPDVVTLQLPGFGCARPDGFDATKEAYVAWLVEEVERLVEEGPIDLVGHDWGGGLVVRLVSERP